MTVTQNVILKYVTNHKASVDIKDEQLPALIKYRDREYTLNKTKQGKLLLTREKDE